MFPKNPKGSQEQVPKSRFPSKVPKRGSQASFPSKVPKQDSHRFQEQVSKTGFQASFAGIGFQGVTQVSRNRFPRTGSQARLPNKGSQAKLPGTDLQARCPGTGVQAKLLLFATDGHSKVYLGLSQTVFKHHSHKHLLTFSCSCCCWGYSLGLFLVCHKPSDMGYGHQFWQS